MEVEKKVPPNKMQAYSRKPARRRITTTAEALAKSPNSQDKKQKGASQSHVHVERALVSSSTPSQLLPTNIVAESAAAAPGFGGNSGVVVNGAIFAFGGSTQEGTVSGNLSYLPLTAGVTGWVSASLSDSSVPIAPRQRHLMCRLGRHLVIQGGVGDGGVPLGDGVAVDLSTNPPTASPMRFRGSRSSLELVDPAMTLLRDEDVPTVAVVGTVGGAMQLLKLSLDTTTASDDEEDDNSRSAVVMNVEVVGTLEGVEPICGHGVVQTDTGAIVVYGGELVASGSANTSVMFVDADDASVEVSPLATTEEADTPDLSGALYLIRSGEDCSNVTMTAVTADGSRVVASAEPGEEFSWQRVARSGKRKQQQVALSFTDSLIATERSSALLAICSSGVYKVTPAATKLVSKLNFNDSDKDHHREEAVGESPTRGRQRANGVPPLKLKATKPTQERQGASTARERQWDTSATPTRDLSPVMSRNTTQLPQLPLTARPLSSAVPVPPRRQMYWELPYLHSEADKQRLQKALSKQRKRSDKQKPQPPPKPVATAFTRMKERYLDIKGILDLIRKTGGACLDLSVEPQEVLDARDMFFIREGITSMPNLRTLIVSGKHLDRTETRMFADMVQQVTQLTRIVDEGTVYTPMSVRDEVQAAAAANVETLKKMKREAKEERSRRREAFQRRRHRELSEHELRLHKQRAYVQDESDRQVVMLEAVALRYFYVLEERLARMQLKEDASEGAQAIQRMKESLAATMAALAELEIDEDVERQQHEKDRHSGMTRIAREEREARRDVLVEQRERYRELKREREAVEREEKIGRQRARQDEDTTRQEMLQWHVSTYKPLAKAHADALEAERQRVERERRQKEIAEREAERRAKALEEMRATHARERDTLWRDGMVLHDRIIMEESKAATQLQSKVLADKKEAQRMEAARERRHMREKAAEAPCVISFPRWRSDRTFVLGSCVGAPLIPESCTLHVTPPKPKYAIQLENSLSQSLGAGDEEQPVIDESLRTDPDEIHIDTWLAQKTIFCGAEVDIKLDTDVEGDRLVHDARFHDKNPDTDVMSLHSGERLGQLTLSEDGKEVHISCSYLNPTASMGLEQLIHSVGFLRSSGSDSSPASGTITAKVHYLKPKEDVKYNSAEIATLRDAASYMGLAIGEGEQMCVSPLVLTTSDAVIGRFGALRFLNDMRLTNLRSNVLPSFPTSGEVEFETVPTQWTATFTVSTAAPIMPPLAPHRRQREYEEGQGDMPLLPRAIDRLAWSGGSFMNGCVLYVDLGPCVCRTDYIWTMEEGSEVIFKPRGVYIGDMCVAKVRERGMIFGHCLYEYDPTRIEMDVCDGIPAAAVEKVMRSLVFRNDTRDPTAHPRRIAIGLIHAESDTESALVFDVTFKLEDDLTVIDYRVCGPHVRYRYPAVVPAQLREIIRVPRCFFGQLADVYDADTDEFEGGFLRVSVLAETEFDKLRLDPPYSSPLTITDEDDVIFSFAKIGKLVHHSDASLEIEFTKASIEIVAELVHTFDYRCTAPQGQLKRREIETVFQMPGTEAVKASCIIRMASPLIHIDQRLHQKLSYQENAGLMRIGYADLGSEDDGWDGGYFCANIISGWTEDDHLVIKQDDELQLVDLATWAASRAKKTQESSPSMSPSGRSRAASPALEKSKQPKESAPITSSEGLHPVERRISTFEEATDEVRVQLNKSQQQDHEAKQKIREAANKRRDEISARRQEVLLQARDQAKRTESKRRRLSEPENATMKAVVFHGKRIGTAIMSHKVLNVYFEDRIQGEKVADRGSEASVRKKDVNAVIRRLHYENVSENPRDLQKVVSLTVSDGLPHTTVSALEIEVIADDDVTELRRLSSAPKPFRTQSDADKAGFCLFNDVTVHDPDTFAFNGCFLHVELVGGGDPKGDQIGFLAPDRQEERMTSASPTSSRSFADSVSESSRQFDPYIISNDKKTLLKGDEVVATVHLNAPNPEGHSNIRFDFVGMPKDVTEPKSHSEASRMPGIISIAMVQKVLNLITYTNTAAKTKAGGRVYQARVGFDSIPDSIGKLRMTLNVAGPLLWLPDFGGDVLYREGSAPTSILPKGIVNITDKEVVRDGFMALKWADGREETDVLGLEFKRSDLITYDVEAGRLEVGERDHIGKVQVTPEGVTVNFDYSCKVTSKQLQQIMRAFTYHSTSSDPGTHERQFTVVMSCKAAGRSQIRTGVRVQSMDNPTEIKIPTGQLEVIRNAGAVPLCPDATVEDPDTSEFKAGSYIDVEIKGGVETDIITSSLVDEIRGTDVVEKDTETGEKTTLAKLIRRGTPSALRFEMVECDLEDLERMVRSLMVEFKPNQHDRVPRKGVILEIKGGEAGAVKSNVSIEVIPQLVEVGVKQKDVSSCAYPVDLLPNAVVPNVHFQQGGTLEVTLSPEQSWYQLKLNLSGGLLLKKKALVHEGKNVSSTFEEEDNRILVVLPKLNAGGPAVIQKLLRGISFQASRLTSTTCTATIKLVDDARSSERILEVPIVIDAPK